MVDTEMRMDGIMTWWKLGEWAYHSLLKSGLSDLGLSKYTPQLRTPAACLKSALHELFPNRTHRVEPLRVREAFEVVQIARGEVENTYTQSLWASIKDGYISIRPYSQAMDEQVARAYNHQVGLLSSEQVTGCLVDVLASLNGTSLRDRGGIYWVPGSSLPAWRQVGDIIQACGVMAGANKVYLIRHRLDADAVRAVRDAIVAEVKGASATLTRDVQDESLGGKALQNRAEQARELARKINLYEELLSVGLDDLRCEVAGVEEAAMTAALLASAEAVTA